MNFRLASIKYPQVFEFRGVFLMKSKNKWGSPSNKKSKNFCDCAEFIFVKNQLVCKRCGRPMKSEKKPVTAKGARYKSNRFDD